MGLLCTLRSRNATALSKQVAVVQGLLNRARKMILFWEKDVTRMAARKRKADINVRACMLDIAQTTTVYESALVALRIARDRVTRVKQRLYRFEKEVSVRVLSFAPVSESGSHAFAHLFAYFH